MKKLFTQHPEAVGETYTKHLWFASKSGIRLVLVGCACVLHGVFPFLFVKTASECIIDMYENMKQRNEAGCNHDVHTKKD